MSRYPGFCIALAGALALSGCAHDKLLRLETAEYAVAAKDAQSKGRAFYDGLIRQDREFWIALNQLDATCKPASMKASYVRGDLSGDRICTQQKTSDGDQALSELDRATLRKQYAALSFIEHYLEALSKASAEPELKAKENFDAAIGDVNTLLSAFKAEEIPTTETAAVGELIGLMEELSSDHESAEDIRRIVAERRDRTDAAFRQLILALKRDRKDEENVQSIKALIESLVGAGANGEPSRKARRRQMEMHFQQRDESFRIAECEAAAGKDTIPALGLSEKDLCPYQEAGMMLAAWRSHNAFLDLIDGRLSAKQKARLVRMQRENFMRMVKLYLKFSALV